MSARDPFRESLAPDGGSRGDYSEIDLGGSDRDAVCELAEEIARHHYPAPDEDDLRLDYAATMTDRLQTFLAEQQENAAHVITKRRLGGGREEVVHYMVGPRRETAEEAAADLERWSGVAKREGAADTRRDAVPPPIVGYYCSGCGLLLDEEEHPTGSGSHTRQTGPSEYEQCGPMEAVVGISGIWNYATERIRLQGQLAALRGALEEHGQHSRSCKFDTPEIKCPQCSGPLLSVPKSRCLNADQWDAVKAGDYYCESCKGDRGETGYKYFNREELPKQSCSCGLNAALAPRAGKAEAEVIRAAMIFGRTYLDWQDDKISDSDFEASMNGKVRDNLIEAVRSALRAARGGEGEG